MIVKGIVRDFGKLISEAEGRIIEGIKDGRMQTEPSITDRFLNELERIFEQQGEKENIVFRARTLRDRGPHAPEHRFGADFCGVLDIQFGDFKQTKGFLSQAKWEEKNGIFVQKGFMGATTASFSCGNEFERLNEQADKMLSVTPDSFIMIYSTKGFVVVPASSIKGLDSEGKLYAKPVDRFFKEYLMCFIGDPRLKAYDDHSLESLRVKTNARTAILFQIHEKRL
ncbi:MAG TPA: hypothetical protein PLE64_03845 [Spirochaetota bacterium]|nr:hypothetical protein [Spirochaetota bacterium]